MHLEELRESVVQKCRFLLFLKFEVADLQWCLVFISLAVFPCVLFGTRKTQHCLIVLIRWIDCDFLCF